MKITWPTVLVATAICGILVAIIYPVYQSARPIGPRMKCLAHVKMMVQGMNLYAADHDERLPDASHWMDSLAKIYYSGPPESRGDMFHDYEGVTKAEYGYAFLREASLKRVAAIDNAANYPLVFDSNLLGRNAAGDTSSMPHPGRHYGKNNVGFLDGHVKSLPAP